jgi:replicative DNA helicase
VQYYKRPRKLIGFLKNRRPIREFTSRRELTSARMRPCGLEEVAMSVEGIDPGTYGDSFGPAYQAHMLAVLARIPGYIVRFRSALDPSYFSVDLHRMVAQALYAHVDKYRVLPSRATLVETLKAFCTKAKLPEAIQIIKNTYAKDITDHESVRDKLVEFGKLAAAANATLQNSLDLDSGDRSKLLERMRKALLVGEDLTNIGIDYTNSANDRASWYAEEENVAIPTGMPHLDAMLRGGGRRGDLHIIAAMTGKGKTTFLINVAYGAITAAKPYNVVYYTLGDLSRKDVAMRLDDRIAGPAFAFKEKDTARYIALLNERVKKLVRGRIYIQHYPRRYLTPTMMRSHLSVLRSEGFDPDRIIVDYGQVMKPERRIGQTWEELGGLAEDLNSIAGEEDADMWSGNQVPQRSYQKPVLELGDLAGGAETGEHAAVVLTFNQTKQEEIESNYRVYGAKCRRKADHGMVVGHVNRARCEMTTEAWLNSAGTLISGKYEGADANDPETQEEEAQKAALKARVLKRSDVTIPRNGQRQIIEPKAYPPKRIIEPTAYPPTGGNDGHR